MKRELEKYFKFLIGMVCCSLGVVIILKSDLGLSPWDVLNQGLSYTFPRITIGMANSLIGVIVILLSLKFKQPIGSGTVLNIAIIGPLIDIFNTSRVNFADSNIVVKIIVFTIGMTIFSYGCYIYMAMGLGCGPRDGLLVALTKATKYSIGVVKFCLEAIALIFGFLLGGKVGIGTVIFTLAVGPIIQFFFKYNKVNFKEVRHRNMKEEFLLFKNYIWR